MYDDDELDDSGHQPDLIHLDDDEEVELFIAKMFLYLMRRIVFVLHDVLLLVIIEKALKPIE